MTGGSDKEFAPRLDILPRAQRQLWSELSRTPHGFVLYGGTAIALRLGHRQSEDFDFFSDQPFVPGKLVGDLKFLNGAEVIQESENTLTCIVDREGPVHVSFFGGLELKRVRAPEVAAGSSIHVASLLDLAATKIAVVLQRAALKDYLDIDALLRNGIELPMALAAARAVYGTQFNPLLSLKALTFFEETDVKQLDSTIRARLTDAVKKVALESLPVLEGWKGLI